MTAATLFSGGGGTDIGLTQAGIDVLWGIEYDDDIVSVARKNGLNIRTADVTEEVPSDYESVDVLHASPPCPNFSVAKTGAEETDEDISLARATVKFIRGIEPSLFTLENVWGYRKSQSWKLIREHLQRSGYDWNAWKLNAANWGVPQTRKRMIVAARKGGPRPTKPTPTHTENPQNGGLFGDEKDEWVGWYEAIKDLIPDLPETELADWQKERLPNELTQTQMIAAASADYANKNRPSQRPQFTVEAKPKGGAPRAVLVSGDSVNGESPAQRGNGLPSIGVGQNSDRVRVVLVDSNDPTFPNGKHPWDTVRATHGGGIKRAIIQRRVVQMTPRCLARFQSFPDWYGLPDSKSLACRIVGNAVPPLAMKKWIRHWT